MSDSEGIMVAATDESVTMNVTGDDVVDDDCRKLQEQVQAQAEEGGEAKNSTIYEPMKKSNGIPVVQPVVTTEESQVQKEDEEDSKEGEQPKPNKKEVSSFGWMKRWMIDFYRTNEFLVLIVVAIILARVYPPLGADYVVPHITSTWVAVIFIFCTYISPFMLFADLPYGVMYE